MTNLLFITVDCLRRDFVENEEADTPFLDSLREDGVFYRDMHATTTTTTPSVASYMTGLYSERNGVNSLLEAELDPDVPTLAETLSQGGYHTYAMVTGPIVPDTNLDRGFDEYWYRDRNENLVGEWYGTAVDRLNTLQEPFLLYLHLWELHRPISVPEEYDDSEYGSHPYTRSLSALDRALERFVAELPDDTVIVLHGDHGESIAWRGSSVHKWLKRGRTLLRHHLGINTRPLERVLNRFMDRFGPSYPDHYIEDGHGETVFDFTTNVPFLIAGTDRDADDVDAQVRQIDVFPTILDLMDVPVPDGLDAESLLPPEDVEDRDAYIRACGQSLKKKENWIRGIRADGKKYFKYPHREWTSELYDLEADPRELRAIPDTDERAEMEERLPDKELMRTGELDIHDRLRDLGYM